MQDKAIAQIGKLRGERKEKFYQNFIDNPFPGQSFDVISAVFSYTEQQGEISCRFEEVEIEKASEKNYLRLAYRKGSSRGGDITFTTKFGDIEKKFKTFYPKQLNEAIAFAQKIGEIKEAKIFEALKLYLSQKAEEVKKRLKEIHESLDKQQQQSSVFTIKFKGTGDKEYLESFVTIQQILLNAGTSGKAKKYNVISEGKNSFCSICLEKKELLYGFASPFKYATVDKLGLVSGFFRQENNWKNYPICPECSLDFELGKKYITKHLNRNFYGKRYFIIPQTIIHSPSILDKALSILGDVKYQKKEGTKIISREEALMRRIGKEEGDKNQYVLNLLFYDENQTTKAIKIKLLLKEIFPSRFREIFINAPKHFESNVIYKDAIKRGKEREDLKFDFQILKLFFEKKFYDVIQSVFNGTPIAEEFLYTSFTKIIREEYNKQNYKNVKLTVLKAMMTLSYFRALNLINKNSFVMEPTNNDPQLKQDQKQSRFDLQKFEEFIRDNSDFFGSNASCSTGIFAVGVLVRQVFNWQSRSLDGNTPFEKKLKGYHLSPNDVKHIYLEALEKINKYAGFHAYQPLRNFLNRHFVLKSHELSKMSNNEISFYFVAGLELGNDFKTVKTEQS